jgi:hypothetical protein
MFNNVDIMDKEYVRCCTIEKVVLNMQLCAVKVAKSKNVTSKFFLNSIV